MPHPTQAQLDRQQALREILDCGPAGTQQSLVDELTARGFEATQSSVSRDLKDIGAVKTTTGYALPSSGPSSGEGGDAEVAQVASLLRDLHTAGPNLIVIKTAIGAAQRVALALDRSGWNEIVGDIGGDDTVFVATSNASAQRNLLRRIERATARA